MRIELNCKICGKPVYVESETRVGNMVMETYKCGHKHIRTLSEAEKRAAAVTHSAPGPVTSTQTAETTEAIARLDEADKLLESLVHGDDTPQNWSDLMPFQREGVLFGEGSNIRFLLGDEPGLGKTVQFIVLLDRNFKQLTKCLIICPPSITTHWERFLKKWLQKDKYDNAKPHRTIYIHKGLNVPLPDNFDITIVGNNLISGEFALASILENEYQCVCVDECHHFKSDDSKRTQALIKIAGAVPHFVAMSGTPIMNRVDEYFPILHMLKPEHWPNKRVLNNICEKNSQGQALQIRQQYRPWFFNRTANYVIRRKKADHLTGLPKFSRFPEFLNPESLNPVAAKRFARAYNQLAEQLEEELAKNEGGNILGLMSTIRRVTGEAKAESAVEYALDLLDADEDGMEKLIIGVHHHNTARIVEHFLNKAARERNDPKLYPLFMDSSQSSAEKDAIQTQFGSPNHRVLVCSILACAEGRDGLQHVCSRMLNLEREWNPAKEEQFEQRIDRYGQKNPVQAVYYMMQGTIDEWMNELVELKRNVVNSTFDANFEVDYDMMRELARKVVANRMRIIGV